MLQCAYQLVYVAELHMRKILRTKGIARPVWRARRVARLCTVAGDAVTWRMATRALGYCKRSFCSGGACS